MEEYREITWIDTRTRYFISNLGYVYSLKNNGIMYKLKPKIDKYGYYTMGFRIKNHSSKKFYTIHRLVAIAFLENDDPTNKTTINHINNIKTDNRLENLEWMSVADNNRYRFKCGYHVDGNLLRVVSDEDAIKMLKLFYYENKSRLYIKKIFKDKYNRTTVENVLSKKIISLKNVYFDLKITDSMVSDKKGMISPQKQRIIYSALVDYIILKESKKNIIKKYDISINCFNNYLRGANAGYVLKKVKEDYGIN